MLLDEHVRTEAIRIDQSFIVQAPAGSGKTSLLVQRFINLLAICNKPEECLAITFTKKAAFEMRDRVLQAIEQQVIYKNSDVNNIYTKILANPNRLKILTIDAFCASLIQKMPILSNGMNLKIAENPKKLYLEAVEQLLKVAYKSEKLTNNLISLLNYLANDHKAIKNLLIDMLAKREQWLPLIVPIKGHVNLKIILEKNLETAIEDVLAELLIYLPKNNYKNKIINIVKQAANNLKNSNIKNNIIYCQNLTNNWPAAAIVDLPIWRGLAELLLNKDGQVRRKVNANQGFLAINSLKNIEEKNRAAELKNSMQELLQYLSEHEKIFLNKLQQITILPDLYNSENWDFLQSIGYLLPELVAHLMVIFQEQQQVDFPQVAITALQALGTEQEPTDVALIMDCKINHILVDEFQDTSVLQFNLLEKLVATWESNDGRTIFLVGDPMQSIYRFRQADVGLFLRAQEYGIANIKLKNLYLTTNFRSSNTIVNNLNKLFDKIFPEENDMILGGVSYSKANSIPSILEPNCSNSEVQFFLASNSWLEAESIVELIKKIKKDYANNKHSIAILVRSRVHVSSIIERLRHHNIKFQANDIELLANQRVICDLITLTRAILHVHDVIAWLALLRSPLVGLKLEDLHVLSEYSVNPLFKELQNYKNNQQLSKDAKLRLNYVLPILFNAISHKESTVNISKLIKKSWVALGGYLLLQPQDLELVEDFFLKLLRLTDITGINVIEELMSEQFVSASQDNVDLNIVQLMTIHKAKGLEFDTVIVPGLAKKTLTSKPQLLLWEERFSKKLNKNYLIFAPIKSANLSNNNNSVYDFMKYSEAQRELYEEQRLLYVAMTRARKNFYGFSNKNMAGNNKSFLKLLESYVIFAQPPYVIAKGGNEDINSKTLYRIPSDWYTLQINHGTDHHTEMLV
ncbi:MAG: UvrD-helicase domain-containing protein [Gammaproteobacteria bacterium]